MEVRDFPHLAKNARYGAPGFVEGKALKSGSHANSKPDIFSIVYGSTLSRSLRQNRVFPQHVKTGGVRHPLS